MHTCRRKLGYLCYNFWGILCRLIFNCGSALLNLTGSADRTVKFWDLETFEIIGSAGPEVLGSFLVAPCFFEYKQPT